MNGFTSYVIAYSILGSLLCYYIIHIGRKLDDTRVRIKEAKWRLQGTDSEE
ncbi:hypothetical protein OAO86_00480 [Euryarchaeota archaeon]|nr:hypothetical protein [Euryarchaeota archaeon]MDB4602401.1 hypothetical protein [Euryarchaeota archaeon]MDC0623588.1 hypothetical protein [Euryarchaeota archaeon]MDC3310226.1 hypothetical protein [Candidatus Poseidoniales archaeon]MDG1543170.1 hypothetical protein [Candidatus Thalassarchaeaceae archaeon]